MPGTLDCLHELALMLRTCSGNPFRNNFSLFGHKTMEFLLIFVIDIGFLILAETAITFFSYLVSFFQRCSPLRHAV